MTNGLPAVAQWFHLGDACADPDGAHARAASYCWAKTVAPRVQVKDLPNGQR